VIELNRRYYNFKFNSNTMQGQLLRLVAAASVGSQVVNSLDLSNKQLSDKQIADLLT